MTGREGREQWQGPLAREFNFCRGVCVCVSCTRSRLRGTPEDVRMRRSCGVAEEEECIPLGGSEHTARAPSGTLCRFPDN